MNRRYPKWSEALQQSKTNTSLKGVVRAVLVDLDIYEFSEAHEFLDDIAPNARVAVSDPLQGKSFKGAIFDAQDIIFPAVVGSEVSAIVLVIDTGKPETSRLVDYFDSGIAGLPLKPNGTGIEIHWNSRGIHAL